MIKEKIKKLDGRSLFKKVSELKAQAKITKEQVPEVFNAWLKENGYILHKVFGWLSPQQQVEVEGMKLIRNDLVDREQLGKVHASNPKYFRWREQNARRSKASRVNSEAIRNIKY